jgi:hypothetical protein
VSPLPRRPGTRSHRSPCRRLNARVRSATKSSRLSERRRNTSEPASGSTVGNRSLRQAASAVARASSPSFLRALPVESTRTRAESLGGTSTTDSPAAANLWAKCLPRPPAFSTAQRRSGNRFAQRSRALKPPRLCGKLAHSTSSPTTPSTTARTMDALWGSTPINTFMHAPPFWSNLRLAACVKDTPTLSRALIPLLSHSARRGRRRDASLEQANPT